MHTILQSESTPKSDGYRMPGEFELQRRVWMLWPHRCDNWSYGAKPAQKAFRDVALAIARFEEVVIGVNEEDYLAAHTMFLDEENIVVIEMSSDDAWMRDCGPTFVVDKDGNKRAVHWDFNAWGGLYDGLYFPWDKDQQVGLKVTELAGVERYRPDNFVLEGGSIHVDGEGTCITTKMCLLSKGRNPHLTQDEIENNLKEYLGVEKVIWVEDGIDPDETNGHIDDVACFIKPGVVGCIYTSDETNPFYKTAKDAYEFLSKQTDAKGRLLKVEKLPMTKNPVCMDEKAIQTIDRNPYAEERTSNKPCIASYANFLIVNSAVIVPQYDDENDRLALEVIQKLFSDREVVGVKTREIVYGGGNIHCITQQEPA